MHVFTDHRSLLYWFAPLLLCSNSPRHVLSKMHRWAIHLSTFEFFINHIGGASIIFADILTRWSKGYRAVSAQRVVALYADIVPSAHEVEDITIKEIINEQKNLYPPVGVEKDEIGLFKKDQRTWIPDDAKTLKLRITVEAHRGERGHQAYDANLETVTQSYWWTNVKKDIREFTQSFIHCIVSRTGERTARPLASALHGSKPNKVVHVDFLYMGSAADCELKYVLVIEDDLSSYTWLHAWQMRTLMLVLSHCRGAVLVSDAWDGW